MQHELILHVEGVAHDDWDANNKLVETFDSLGLGVQQGKVFVDITAHGTVEEAVARATQALTECIPQLRVVGVLDAVPTTVFAAGARSWG